MFNCAPLEKRRTGAAASPVDLARYVIYYTPQPGTALAAFGRSWFGRANGGMTLQAFSDSGLAGTSFAKIAAAPGSYAGLHALLRAPFTLRDGVGVDAVKSRIINFAARRKPIETGPLTLSRAGRSLVLRPVEAKPALEWLAAQCVAAFEDFAAPPSDVERTEYAVPDLNDYQRVLLESFGDPYVLSEYRFAITLTGPLDATHLERVAQALWPVLEEICASGVSVDALSLFGDTGGRSPMRLIGRYRLAA